ncbi:hypothetical protein Dsin_010291 [Dipteronia sinensis]|uniref:WAT1-related protein n=1 Tax=Dipteronia sinensis TaxID=43782 RepID=A0AAE0ECJ2_9ROSI|nr:hypothetical protein Dsin_010291 [Dipteronia sinensis]
MGVSGKLEEVVPFALMVTMEGSTIALTILAKTAMTGGMSPFVFIVYTNTLASIILLPFSFLFHRGERIQQPLFTLPLLLRFFFMGLTGIAIAQNCAFLGLYYSSPIVVCVMGLTIPAVSFIVSLIFRTTKLDWKSSSIRVKVVGTLISIMGALMVEIYKGPFIRKASSSQLQSQKPSLFVFYTAPDRWVLGGILLATSSLSVSLWNIIQMGTIKLYPQPMKVASFYSIAGTLQCALISLMVERDLNSWKLKLNWDLLLIVVTVSSYIVTSNCIFVRIVKEYICPDHENINIYVMLQAIFGSIIRTSVHISCTHMKGSFYVPLFKPFGIVFATTFGVSFFTNALHYGSVIGAVITGMGYYTVMWGQLREDELRKRKSVERVESSDENVPLLQEENEV